MFTTTVELLQPDHNELYLMVVATQARLVNLFHGFKAIISYCLYLLFRYLFKGIMVKCELAENKRSICATEEVIA